MNQISTQINFKKHVWLCFIAGLVLPLGYAPFHLPAAIFLSLGLLFALLLQTSAFKKAFLYGFVFGLGYLGLGVSWVFVSIHEYGHLNIVFSALVTGLFITYLSLFPALAASGFALLKNKHNLFISCLVFSACWCLSEYLRATFLGGFPWLITGFGQMDTPFRYLLPYIGLYGAGFFACFAAALLATVFITKTSKRYLWSIVFVVLVITPYLFKDVSSTTFVNTPISVGVVQANLSMRDKWDESLFWQLLKLYQDGLEALLLKNKLIVLPESAIPLPEGYVSEYLSKFHEKAQSIGSSILLGIPEVVPSDPNQYYNTMLTLGQGQGNYLKQHLVPFGEFIPQPLQGLFSWLQLPSSNMMPGKKNQSLIQVLNHPIASLICYELAYPQLLRRQMPAAEWIVSISDDGWFGHSFAMYQHLQMAQALSLQMNRYQIVANNDGLSSIINHHGEVIDSLPAFSQGLLESQVYPVKGSTFWVRWGDGPILIFLSIIILLAGSMAVVTKYKKLH